MKKSVLIILLVFGIFLLPMISAETTFFEGDYNYRDDFIMASLPENVIEILETQEDVEILQTSGGGYFLEEEYNNTLVCEVCIESLKEHIKEKQHANYDEEAVTVLTGSINQEFQTDLSNNQVRYIIENFEEECDMPYPLLGGIAGGRLRNLTNPLVFGISLIILISIIILGYFIKRALKKRGYGRHWKIKKNKT